MKKVSYTNAGLIINKELIKEYTTSTKGQRGTLRSFFYFLPILKTFSESTISLFNRELHVGSASVISRNSICMFS